jgi:hypothetical protein
MMFKNIVPISQKGYYVYSTNISQLMLQRIIAVNCENLTKHLYTLCVYVARKFSNILKPLETSVSQVYFPKEEQPVFPRNICLQTYV